MIRWSYVEVIVMTFAPPIVRIAPVAMIEPWPFMTLRTQPPVQNVDRDRAKRGRGRDGERVRHVLRKTGGGAGDGRESRRERGAGSGSCRCSGGYRSLLRAPEHFGAARRDNREVPEGSVI